MSILDARPAGRGTATGSRLPSLQAEALQPELDALAAEIPAARAARPEQFVDSRFLDELGRAGPARQPNR